MLQCSNRAKPSVAHFCAVAPTRLLQSWLTHIHKTTMSLIVLQKRSPGRRGLGGGQ